MTDHGGAASPRTEAGKRLRRWVLNETGSARKGAWSDKLDDLLAAIEAEAAQEAPAPEGLRVHPEFIRGYNLGIAECNGGATKPQPTLGNRPDVATPRVATATRGAKGAR